MKSSELLMLQDVWRKAWQEGELELTFRTKAGATRARLQLYNAVKSQKAGTDLEDMELVRAAEGLEIIKTSETSLRLQRKDGNDMMQGLAAALGRTVHEYVDPAAAENAEKMLRELGMGKDSAPAPAEHQDNPFYGKRGE